MYQSPITMAIKQMATEVAEKFDDMVFNAVYEVLPTVDKDELLRALRYDRGQYDKGFVDGKAAAMDELVRCKDCKHGELDEAERDDYYLCHYHGCDWNDGCHFCSYGERRSDD